jgi:spermidine synthase
MRSKGRQIGVIGLGVGTLSAYATPVDRVTYYEIDPQVKLFADEMFTFLHRSRAAVEVVLGDGRVSLERQPAQGFDVLVLDAFSSDAIPTHLLTAEAFALYTKHLDARGVIAVNVTNRHLDLEPVVRGAADALGMRAVIIRGSHQQDRSEGLDWMLLTRDASLLADPVISSRSSQPTGNPSILWTDEYISIWPVLK